jgi:two-component system LytT family response regulator
MTSGAAPSRQELTTIIVDDESLARRGLKLRLAELDGVEVLAECRNGREAIEAIRALEPDLVFLDIQMPGLDGFDVVRELQADHMPLIVFVTAFDQYAINAFDVHAVDYVLKPVEEARLEEAVTRARNRLAGSVEDDQKQRLLEVIVALTGKSKSAIEEMLQADNPGYPDKLTIKDGPEVVLLQTRDIDWVDAAGDYMCIHAAGETHVMRSTMKDLETQLDPGTFRRIHRSTLVNLERVVKLSSHINGEYFLTLDCGANLKMSRTYRNNVAHLL